MICCVYKVFRNISCASLHGVFVCTWKCGLIYCDDLCSPIWDDKQPCAGDVGCWYANQDILINMTTDVY